MPDKQVSSGADRSRHRPLRQAILTLLAIRPMSGYDIRRTYERSMQRVWYAPIGQVYPILRAMECDGLLQSSIHIQRARPNRREYRLSPSGERALDEWLTDPAALPRMHHEFLHKMFLLNRMQPTERTAFVAAYVHTCEDWAAHLAEIDRKFSATDHGAFAEAAHYQLMSLRHLRRIVAAEISSAQEISAGLQGGPAGLTGPQSRPRASGRAGMAIIDLNLTPVV